MNEIWRPVVGFADYEVSNLGRFRRATQSRGAVAGRVLKWHTCTSSGYASIRFRHGGRQVTKIVHNEVCKAFYGPKPAGLLVRHLDGNKLNNCAANLAYGTAIENARDKILHGRSYGGDLHHKARLSTAKAEQIRIDYGLGVPAKKMAVQYGVSESTIFRVLSGKFWNASNRNMDRSAA